MKTYTPEELKARTADSKARWRARNRERMAAYAKTWGSRPEVRAHRMEKYYRSKTPTGFERRMAKYYELHPEAVPKEPRAEELSQIRLSGLLALAG